MRLMCQEPATQRASEEPKDFYNVQIQLQDEENVAEQHARQALAAQKELQLVDQECQGLRQALEAANVALTAVSLPRTISASSGQELGSGGEERPTVSFSDVLALVDEPADQRSQADKTMGIGPPGLTDMVWQRPVGVEEEAAEDGATESSMNGRLLSMLEREQHDRLARETSRAAGRGHIKVNASIEFPKGTDESLADVDKWVLEFERVARLAGGGSDIGAEEKCSMLVTCWPAENLVGKTLRTLQRSSQWLTLQADGNWSGCWQVLLAALRTMQKPGELLVFNQYGAHATWSNPEAGPSWGVLLERGEAPRATQVAQ